MQVERGGETQLRVMNGKNIRNMNRNRKREEAGGKKKKKKKRWKAYEGNAVQVWRESSLEKNSGNRAGQIKQI